MKKVFRHQIGFSLATALTLLSIPFGASRAMAMADTAPSTYNAYTGTDPKPLPPAPALGPANSVVTDPTFGSRILRVTDANTKSGQSFISTDSGFARAFNANSTAIKLTGPRGDGYWLEFNPTTFQAGDGSSRPVPHAVPFGATWEWSAVDPDIIYYLTGNQIAKYNKATGVSTNLGGPSTGDPVGYMAVVIGQDNWVCSAAGPGAQNTRSKIFCLNPVSPGTRKFIDVYNKTINGVPQGDPNWPTSAPGAVIGIHDIAGGTGPSWLEVTFHQTSWGGNGGAIFNLATNTWSLITKADYYWSGHVSMGNGKYANASGSINGRDSRGMVLRNPDNAMNSADYKFIYQPPTTANGWCDADHSSWLNSLTNPGAPILISRYGGNASCYQHAWTGEINAAAVDGSNTVWRFAHNYNQGSCYYAQAFAQISADGKWALFSSPWGGGLGADTAFGCSSRIDTFIVDLMSAGSSSSNSGGSGSGSTGGSGGSSGSTGGNTGSTPSTPAPSNPTPPPVNPTPPPAGNIPTTTRVQQNGAGVVYSGTGWANNNNGGHSGGSAALAMDKGSRATLTFNGTGVRWIGYRDEWSGIANVYIDGTLKSKIDTYAKPQQAQYSNYSITDLSSGSHTIAIEVSGSRNASSAGLWIWVDAFDVISAPSANLPASTYETIPAGISLTSSGGTALEIGSAEVNGSATGGIAIIGYRQNGALTMEASVPAAVPVLRGRIDVEIKEAVNTGFAIANPNDSAASVSFFFTDENGKDSKPGMLTLPPHGQIARFLSESPFHAPNANGTFTFSSEIPVSAVAIRGLTNERSEFLATTLPIANPDQPAEAALHFPQVADGGGWTTQFTLVNPTDETITGNVSYAGQQGTAGSSLAYSIPPRSSRRLTTAGTGAVTLIGAAQIRPDASSTAPVGLALYSYKQGSVTVSQAGVPSVATGKAFRQFVESPADGLVRTGFAIKNISGNATNVTLDLYKLDGSYAGFSGSLPLAGSQQRSLFLDEIEGFAEMPRPFKGFLRIRSGSGTDLAVFGLRGRTNERGEFLIAATPPVDESAPAVGKMTFPHLVNGEGYGTQFVLYGNGTLKLHDQSGASLNLNMQ